MLLLEISAQKGWNLPPVNRWLSPDYRGPEDLPVEGVREGRSEATLPGNWKKDFPDYSYQFTELYELKLKLNTAKKQIDPISRDSQARERYDLLTDLVRLHDELRGKGGILVREFGAEIVTNAWLKMFELTTFLAPLLSKLQKARTGGAKTRKQGGASLESSERKRFYSLHVAEAPGNFMLAINHRVKTEYPGVDWHWLASSYRDLYTLEDERNVHYLSDQYGLIAQNPERWIFGADGDGDITSPANIRSFSQTVKERFGKLHLFTSDVKYVPPVANFDEEERINAPVHLGHVLSALVTLSPGGVMILKKFTLFEASSVSLLLLLSLCFEKLFVVKPETSRPANSEIYVVGTGFKPTLTLLQTQKLLEVMNYIRFLNTEAGSPSLFLREDIPDSLFKKVLEIETKLVESQITHINRNLELFKEYKNAPLGQVRRDLAPAREKAARAWIQNMGIKPLSEAQRISHPPPRREFPRFKRF